MGEAFVEAPAGKMIQTTDLRYPFMPPFVGTDEELEALAAYLASLDGASDETRLAQKEIEP
jgi:cytochrome c1